jgi:hypothetical protein
LNNKFLIVKTLRKRRERMWRNQKRNNDKDISKRKQRKQVIRREEAEKRRA